MRHTTTPRKVLLIGLLVLLMSIGQPHPASAGAHVVWTSIGPEGGDISALAIDPKTPTTLYAGTWGGGVVKAKELEYSVHLPLILRN